MKNESKIYLGDSEDILPTFEAESVDLIVTDPPYGLSSPNDKNKIKGFMDKSWDVCPPVSIWEKCYRVLKPGAFAFVMSIPRQDCLAHMIVNLGDAGFNIAFSSIYWTYGTGFPKATSLSKQADKRAGVKREVIGKGKYADKGRVIKETSVSLGNSESPYITRPATEEAKLLDGAYSGLQPKPAVEVIIVAMKPIEGKTYLDQAINNGHGCTWLDNCRIPYDMEESPETVTRKPSKLKKNAIGYVRQDEPMFGGTGHIKGRFPANVLCEDDILNNGRGTKSTGGIGVRRETTIFRGTEGHKHFNYNDEGSFSRYFSLDAWFGERIKLLPREAQKTFPWLIVPKASKREKIKNVEINTIDNSDTYNGKFPNSKGDKENSNNHPTIKPIKLMTWLITLGSREGDVVLDPFLGSGTTCMAAAALGRYCKGIEREKAYYDIACKRGNLAQKLMSSYF